MKLGRWLMVVSLAGTLGASAGPTMIWGSIYAISGSGGGTIYGPDGTLIPTTSDWAAQIFTAGNFATPAFTTVGNITDFWSVLGTPGACAGILGVPDGWQGLSAVTRIYNNANPALATMWVDTGITNFSWQTAPLQSSMNYLIGPVTSTDWIPEPAAAGFVLAGLGALLVRRIRRRNAV